jgi:hypothetical protein
MFKDASNSSKYVPVKYDLSADIVYQQPTKFLLHTHSLQSVFSTPSLIEALAEYSESRLSRRHPDAVTGPSSVLQKLPLAQGPTSQNSRSLLFLQVSAAADYFSADQSLMQNVPPVHVDISKSLHLRTRLSNR